MNSCQILLSSPFEVSTLKRHVVGYESMTWVGHSSNLERMVSVTYQGPAKTPYLVETEEFVVLCKTLTVLN